MKEEGGVRRVGGLEDGVGGGKGGGSGGGNIMNTSIKPPSIHYLPRILQEINEIIPAANVNV